MRLLRVFSPFFFFVFFFHRKMFMSSHRPANSFYPPVDTLFRNKIRFLPAKIGPPPFPFVVSTRAKNRFPYPHPNKQRLFCISVVVVVFPSGFRVSFFRGGNSPLFFSFFFQQNGGPYVLIPRCPRKLLRFPRVGRNYILHKWTCWTCVFPKHLGVKFNASRTEPYGYTPSV